MISPIQNKWPGRWLSRLVILGGMAGLMLGGGGRLFSPLDIFAHFTPHFAGMFFSGCLAIIFPRNTLPIIVLGALVTLGAHPLITAFGTNWTAVKVAQATNLSQSEQSAHSDLTTPIKIVSFNSWHSHPNPGAIREFINVENADIVVLLEFGPNKLKLMEELRTKYPYSSHCADRWHCSVVVLSKLAISAHGSGGPETTIPAHVWTTIEHAGRPLTIIGAHLHRPVDGMNRHRRQFEGLARLSKKFPDAVLVAGDLNTTRWADSYRLFQSRSGLTPMTQYLPSWPAGFAQLAIDHIFYNDKIKLDQVKTGKKIGSDHLPLIATFRLK